MDNNKIVDNLNFIKIYFRIFTYKIIVAKKSWIIQKRDKNLRIWIENMYKCKAQLKKTKKMSLKCTRTWKCNCHSALLECRTALSKCQMAPIRALARLSSGDDKTHHFWLFCRRTRPNSHSNHHCLFFKHSSLYK